MDLSLGGFELFGVVLLLITVLPVGLILLAVVVVFSGRDDPDPSSRRPETLYLCAASFVATFTLLFAAYGVANAVARMPLDDDRATFDFTTPDGSTPERASSGGENDDEVRAAVQAGLLALVALAVLVPHVQRLRSVVQEPGFDGSPARRVYIGYLYATSFVAVVLLLATVTVVAYSAFSALAPGVAASDGTGDRSNALVSISSLLVLVGGAGTVLLLHLREAGRWRRPTAATPAFGAVSPQGWPPPPGSPGSPAV
jgi:hypothetical protein